MPRKHHYLKCETEYFQAVEKGLKRFEIRKNDRDFKVHDMIVLKEEVERHPTGREIGPFEIIYILYGGNLGVEPGYCVMQIK